MEGYGRSNSAGIVVDAVQKKLQRMFISFGGTINHSVYRRKIGITAVLIIRKNRCTVKGCDLCSYNSVITLYIAAGNLIIKTFVYLLDQGGSNGILGRIRSV